MGRIGFGKETLSIPERLQLADRGRNCNYLPPLAQIGAHGTTVAARSGHQIKVNIGKSVERI